MSYVNQTTGLAYNFKTQDTDASSKTVYRTPSFPVVEVITSGTGSTIAIATLHPVTIVEQALATATPTINITSTDPHPGDRLILKLTADGTTRVVTFGTGFKSTGTISVTASSLFVVTFIYDGTNWVEASRTTAITP